MFTPDDKGPPSHPSASAMDSGLRTRSGPGSMAMVCGRSQRVVHERRTTRVDFYGIDDGGPAVYTTTPCDLPDCCLAAPSAPRSFGGELRKLLAGLVGL